MMQNKKTIYRFLVAIAFVIIVVIVAVFVMLADSTQSLTEYQLIDEFSESRVLYEADNHILALPTDCVVFSWSAENISAIYFNGLGVAGQGEQTLCGMVQKSLSNNVLRVVSTDGVEKIYQIPIAFGASYYVIVLSLLALYVVVLPLLILGIGVLFQRQKQGSLVSEPHFIG